MRELFDDMVSKGFISFENTWLERAIEQKAKGLTVYLAHSRQLPLFQDELGKAMGLVLPNETTQINWN